MSVLELAPPFRLARGWHPPKSPFACAMKVISWENGDKWVSHFPACSARHLSGAVQEVNDNYCKHATPFYDTAERRSGLLLCPPCSIDVLDLAHRTVGTAGNTKAEEMKWIVELLVGEHGVVHSMEHRWQRAYVEETARVVLESAGGTPDRTPPAQLPPRLPGGTFALTVRARLAWSDTCFVGMGNLYVNSQPGSRLEAGHHVIDAWERATGRTPTPTEPDKVMDAVSKTLVAA